LRPKQLYDEILIPNNCVIPFIFTEYSITEIGAGGIWDHPEYPTIDSLTTEFAKADTAMSKMYYCLGLSGFSMGEGWSRYDMRTMWPELCDMMLRVSGRENALPPDVAPQPPVNVLPVAPYDKRYNVVEADIPLARRFEIYAFCAETQQTVGPAATDAVSWATELLDAGKSVVMAVWDRKTEDRPAWIVWAYNIDPRIEVEFMGTSPPDVIWDRDVTEGLPYRTDIPEFPEGWSLRSLDEIDALTFHHTYGAVDPADMYWYVYEKDGVGRPSQPYTLWIMGDGEIVKANELEWACYHDHTGYPNYHLSVGVAGRLDTAPPTQAQLESMVKVANWAVDHPEMQILDSDITGHMDWTTTECPGWSSQGSGYWKNTFLNMWHPVDSQVTGVHAAPILSAPVNGMDNEISRLRSLREIPNWYKLLYNGDHGMLTWIRLLKDSGIEPVVRLYEPGSHLPGRNPRVVLHAAEVVAAGGEFIEGMNEPNIEMANADWHNLSQANTLAQSWWDDAMYIISVGGKAAFPAMAPTDRGAVNQTVSGVEWFNRIMDWAVDYHYEEFKSYVEQGKIWLAVHVSPFNKLFDFDPEQDGYVDDFCILYYEYLQDQFYEELGSIPVTISTEGGAYSPSHMHDLTFPVVNGFVVDGDGLPIYNDAGWGDYTWDLDSFLRKHNTLDGMCSWTFSDQGVADQRWVGSGWYDKNGAPRSPAL